ncbi:MAG: SurA N-terminal domain-containing protein, partial [Planctomycetota bacterium]
MHLRPTRLVALLAVVLLAACSSDPEVTPSPLPPGYRPIPAGAETAARPLPGEERGEALDEKLAVVAGEVITRRRLLREMKGQGPGQDEAALERALHQLLKQRARLLLFVKEAQRTGISLSEQKLDEVVQARLEASVKEASETVGQPVTV